MNPIGIVPRRQYHGVVPVWARRQKAGRRRPSAKLPKELDHGPKSCGATLAEPGNKKSLANRHFGNRLHSAQTVS